jgi:hypothetical protein
MAEMTTNGHNSIAGRRDITTEGDRAEKHRP